MFGFLNFNNLLISFEMILYCFILGFCLPKRKHFCWATPLFALLIIVGSYFYPFVEATSNIWCGFALYLTLFGLLYVWTRITFDCHRSMAFFLALSAYTLQNMAASISGLPNDILVGFGKEVPLYVKLLSSAFAFFVILALVFYLQKSFRQIGGFILPAKKALWITGLLLLIDIVDNLVIIFYGDGVTNMAYLLSFHTLTIISGLIAVFLLFGLLNENHLSKELEITEKMWKEDQKQYELAKQNMEQLNIKAHDLKHQIHKLAKGDKGISKETGDAIEEVLNRYNTHIVTGSEALDVLLAEKIPLCQSRNIVLSVIADGKSLSFLSDSDIYSLFGNALDNAIEAVSQLPEKGEISLKVSKQGNGVFVQVRNPYHGELHFQNGLPITSKGDTINHGFGTRSMELLAKKYHGVLSIDAKDQIFSLNILFYQTN